MTKAIRFHQTGGPEVLKWEDVEVGEPGPGQIRIRHTAIGLNYLDTYHRSGVYPLPLPSGVGSEGAGVVTAVGKGVKEFKKGDRVAYASPPVGSYAEERLMPADRVVKIPAGISDRTAAAMMLKGMTARYLIKQTYPAKKGETVLVHAAAGGVGLILCQWLKELGVKTIGTVGTKEKAALAKKHSCTWPVVYT
ncbi:MAG: quinone oxidoreductase, partial [Alphaproteobacteria bacterium]|nr:quinone oxidoreductase [Alphaproteobacteria bacterium]